MDSARNTQLVQDAYAAFGRGDVNAILDVMADDVVWQPIIGCGPHVPMAGTRRGKDGVREFFRILAENVTFEQFEPKEFVAQGDKVVALGHYRARTTPGGTFEGDWVMVFTIANGRVTRFREYTDTAAINAAFERAAV